MSWGFVYVLSNGYMPGIYKIGFTERAPAERMEQLSSVTAAPISFDLVMFAQMKNPREAEKALHDHFDAYRVNPGREFFEVKVSEIMEAFEVLIDRSEVFTTMHYNALVWEEEQENDRYMRQLMIDHFLDQCHDPIHWSKRRGFE